MADNEAEAADFKDTETGKPLKKVKEESYFLRMSKYHDWLVNYIENENPSFVQPASYRNEILGRLRKDRLRDLSLSRTSFQWGIPMPEGFDEKHVMYVWFDALSNYLTGVHYLDEQAHEMKRYWPANVQIIGKDIIWFHCVIWPCMLKSAGLPLPKTVFSHGFVYAADGRKMGKSLGNAVEPHLITAKYSVDSIRYYMCSSATYGADLNFSEEVLTTNHNSELADTLGNLVHRSLNLCKVFLFLCRFCPIFFIYSTSMYSLGVLRRVCA